MDDPRIGQVLRAVRIRLGLRQLDVANRAGVSQQLVSSIERGQIDQRALHTVRAVAQALEVRLVMTASWRGTDLARLLDAAHASLVERVAAHLRASGWLVLVEYSFNHYGERGSVDVVACIQLLERLRWLRSRAPSSTSRTCIRPWIASGGSCLTCSAGSATGIPWR